MYNFDTYRLILKWKIFIIHIKVLSYELLYHWLESALSKLISYFVLAISFILLLEVFTMLYSSVVNISFVKSTFFKDRLALAVHQGMLDLWGMLLFLLFEDDLVFFLGTEQFK